MSSSWIIICVFIGPSSSSISWLSVKPFVVRPPLISNIWFFRFVQNNFDCLFIRITDLTACISSTKISMIDFIPCISIINGVLPQVKFCRCESLLIYVLSIHVLVLPMFTSIEIDVIFIIGNLSDFTFPFSICFLMICSVNIDLPLSGIYYVSRSNSICFVFTILFVVLNKSFTIVLFNIPSLIFVCKILSGQKVLNLFFFTYLLSFNNLDLISNGILIKPFLFAFSNFEWYFGYLAIFPPT